MSWFEEAPKRRKWLVGVSGGADSVALLHLLLENGFRNLVVCHLDHGLRGRASTGDAAFVKRLSERAGLPFMTEKTDVARVAAESRESIESAARHARHDFFRRSAVLSKSNRIILAHHADDQAETVLWNLLRGSHGLKGMNESQLVHGLEIHRPLLGWRRSELREWLGSRKLKWREDATNAEPIAVRNRLRNEVLPLLAEVAGRDPIVGLVHGAEDWVEQRQIVEWALARAEVMDPQNRLHLKALAELPSALRKAAVAKYLTDQGISLSRELLERVIAALDPANPASVNLPGGKKFRRRAGRGFVE